MSLNGLSSGESGPPDERSARRLGGRDWLVVGAAIGGALVATFPGFHLLQLWLPRYVAMLISHAIGLALLVSAVQQWRARRALRRADR